MATTYALSPGSSHHPGPDLSVFFLQVTPHHDEAARGVGEGAGRGDGPACPAAALGVKNSTGGLTGLQAAPASAGGGAGSLGVIEKTAEAAVSLRRGVSVKSDLKPIDEYEIERKHKQQHERFHRDFHTALTLTLTGL